MSADRCKKMFCGAEPRSVRAWRDHLDHIEDVHIGSLKREADAELARIERCRSERREPKRVGLVPRQLYGTRPR